MRGAVQKRLKGCGLGRALHEVAAELWGITDRELKEIRRSLEELG